MTATFRVMPFLAVACLVSGCWQTAAISTLPVNVVEVTTPASRGEGSVVLNSASPDEIERGLGVDRQVAVNIVRFRERNGNYTSIEDLRRVQGVTPEMINEWRRRADRGRR